MLPEGFDEKVPLPIGLQLAEDVPFQGGDDVDDLLLQPLLVVGGRARRLGRGRLGVQSGGKSQNGQDRGKDSFLCFQDPDTPFFE